MNYLATALLTVTLISVFYPIQASGQISPSNLEVGLSYARGQIDSEQNQSVSLSASRPVGSFLEGDLSLDMGARYTFFSRSSILKVGTSKSLTLSEIDLHAINFMVGSRYSVSSRFSIGFDLDLLGFTFGKQIAAEVPVSVTGSASPKQFNLVLGGARDLGTLNSEFYLSYRPSDRWSLKTGLSHQVIEYDSSIAPEKAQRFLDLIFVGLTAHL